MAIFTIFSAGAMGTALAIHLAKKKHKVNLYCYIKEDIRVLREKRQNVRFLPGVKLPRNIEIVTDYSPVKESDCVIVSVPTKAVKMIAANLKLKPKTIVLSTCKGVEAGKRATQFFRTKNTAVFMGPCFAAEIARGKRTCTVIAGKKKNVVDKLQKWLATKNLNVIKSLDLTGAELGGVLKNAYAIAGGMCDGLNTGPNAKAVVVARSFDEMIDIGKKFGAKEQTLLGLAGLGDLLVTSYGPSRNRQLGEFIAKGKSLGMVLKQLGTVEGVTAIKAFASKKFPILYQLHKILFKKQNPSSLLNLFWP